MDSMNRHSDAMQPQTHLHCTCIVCGQTFTRAPKNKTAQYCRASACLSEMRRRNGMAGHALRWQKHEPVKPPETAYHTILQPQMSAYIASLAASNTQGLHP